MLKSTTTAADNIHTTTAGALITATVATTAAATPHQPHQAQQKKHSNTAGAETGTRIDTAS